MFKPIVAIVATILVAVIIIATLANISSPQLSHPSTPPDDYQITMDQMIWLRSYYAMMIDPDLPPLMVDNKNLLDLRADLDYIVRKNKNNVTTIEPSDVYP